MLNATKKSELRSGAVARERRVHPRYSFSATMEAVHLQADTRLAGRISDLSHGGCYVDTINPFPVGADVKLRIANGNESLVAQARVAYAADGMGMGLEFTHMDQERAKTLERWLADTSGASRAAQALEDAPVEPRPVAPGEEARFVLNELIITLIRKRVLNEAEGRAMLKKLLG